MATASFFNYIFSIMIISQSGLANIFIKHLNMLTLVTDFDLYNTFYSFAPSLICKFLAFCVFYTWKDVKMNCNALKCDPFASLAFNKCPHFLSDRNSDVQAHWKRWYQTCKLYLTVFTQCNYVFTHIFTIVSKVYLYIYCMILYYNIVLGDTS